MRLGVTEKKRSPEGYLTLKRKMIGLEQSLVVNHKMCCGCHDCVTVCPSKAVSFSDKIVANKCLLKKGRIDIDAGACTFCGACAVLCPAKAISWQQNKETIPTLITTGILPELEEYIEIQVNRCRLECNLVCRDMCPAEAIQVVIDSVNETGKIQDVEVDRHRCRYCGKCETACPYSLIRVRSSRQGFVVFFPELCPPGCRVCTQVCPTGALSFSEGRVILNEDWCIYCRACTQACPEDGALEVKRDRIRGKPIQSRLWVEIQGQLVSPSAKLRLIDESAAAKRARACRTRID